MTLQELRQALATAESLISKIELENPKLRLNLVASMGYGAGSNTMSDLEFFRNAGSIFVKCDLQGEALFIDTLRERVDRQISLGRKYAYVLDLREKITSRLMTIVPQIPIDDSTKIELKFDERDEESFAWLEKRVSLEKGFGAKNVFAYNRICIGRAIDILRASKI